VPQGSRWQQICVTTPQTSTSILSTAQELAVPPDVLRPISPRTGRLWIRRATTATADSHQAENMPSSKKQSPWAFWPRQQTVIETVSRGPISFEQPS